MSVPLLFLVLATGFNGLLAGLYAAFSVAVMPGLARADDRTLIGTMVWINERILNLWFIALFLGSPLLAVAAAGLALADGAVPAAGWVIAGALLALAGLGITVRVHVPLNIALAAAGPEGTRDGSEPAAVRAVFERPWVRWHTVRTLVSVAAFAALLTALAAAAA
jgi:uncharacterized membrane protein